MDDLGEFIPVPVDGKTEYLNRAEVEAALAKTKEVFSPQEYRLAQEMYRRYLKAVELIRSGRTSEEEVLRMMQAPLDPKNRPDPDEA